MNGGGLRWRAGVLGVVVVLASALSPAGAASAAPLIAYADNRSGTYDLYLMRTDGTGRRQVTSGLESDTSPSWAPDGRRLVFWSSLAGTSQLTVVDTDGRNRRVLPVSTRPDGLHHLFPPAWSPDGRAILFESNRDGGATTTVETDLYLIRPEGTGLRRLTDARAVTAAPAWAPDGRSFVFAQQGAQGTNGFPDLYAGDLDGRRTTLTQDRWHDWEPEWSPDGRSLLFMSNRNPVGDPAQPFRVHVRRPSGAVVLVTPTAGRATATSPSWTPDGKGVVYAFDPDGDVVPSLGYFGGTDLRVIPPGPLPSTLRITAIDGRGDRALTDGSSSAVTPAVFVARR